MRLSFYTSIRCGRMFEIASALFVQGAMTMPAFGTGSEPLSYRKNQNIECSVVSHGRSVGVGPNGKREKLELIDSRASVS